jgi:two-component system OmpR family response regulator
VDYSQHGSAAATGARPLLRVLCVDDNRDVADSTVELLRLVGFSARACYDGPSAIVEASDFRPGACLIDLNMPRMDGDELAARLKAQSHGAPLVLVAITAMNNEVSKRRIRDAGFDMHLVKPVDPHDLLVLVDRLWQTATDERRQQG